MDFYDVKIYSAGFDIQRQECKCWVQVKDGKARITVPGLLEPITIEEGANHVIQIRCYAPVPGPSQAVLFEIERKPSIDYPLAETLK